MMKIQIKASPAATFSPLAQTESAKEAAGDTPLLAQGHLPLNKPLVSVSRMFLAIGWCVYVPGRSTVLHFDDVKLSRIGSVMERKNRRRVYALGQFGVGILSLFGERSPPAHANFKISALQGRRGSIHCRLCSSARQHSWKKSKHHCKLRSL